MSSTTQFDLESICYYSIQVIYWSGFLSISQDLIFSFNSRSSVTYCLRRSANCSNSRSSSGFGFRIASRSSRVSRTLAKLLPFISISSSVILTLACVGAAQIAVVAFHQAEEIKD